MITSKCALDGTKAKDLRKKKFSTVKQVVTEIFEEQSKSVSDKTIRQIEKGEQIKKSTAELYANAIGVPLDDLTIGKEPSSRREIDLTGAVLFGQMTETVAEMMDGHDGPANFEYPVVLRESITLLPATPKLIHRYCVFWTKPPKQAYFAGAAGERIYPEDHNWTAIDTGVIWHSEDDLTITSRAAEILTSLYDAIELVRLNKPEPQTEFSMLSLIQRGNSGELLAPLLETLKSISGLHFLAGVLTSHVDDYPEEYTKHYRPILYLCSEEIKSATLLWNSFPPLR